MYNNRSSAYKDTFIEAELDFFTLGLDLMVEVLSSLARLKSRNGQTQ